ncbi:MAG: hypothetical protein KF857_05545 [Fimbriimonadaceae bacterium]|nr:hypothetical protein [Fimbriimonadaceae bacterium]
MAVALGLGQTKPADGDLTRFRAETVIVLNAFRQRLGLEPALPDDRLDDAATSHARYLDGTGRVSHSESREVTGFLGATPRDRARQKGFVKPLGEVVTTIDGKGSEAYQSGLVRLLLQPYHRMPLFSPGPLVMGTGPGKGFLVIDYSPGKAKTLPANPIVFPFDGQEGVPPAVVVNEMPDPLRLHPGAGKLVGMPITVQFYGLTSFAFVGARLTTRKGEVVDMLVNHPGNDNELRPGEVVCMPARPLKSKTEYSFELVVKSGENRQTTLRTGFTTGTPDDAWTVFVLGVKK